jgi:hypothetical protein
MRILLIGLTGAEPAFHAWYDWLERAGVPFDAIQLNEQRPPVSILDEAGNAHFQGLILASSGLLEAALEPSQRSALERLERDSGLRRLTAYAYPGPEYGLTPPAWAGPLENGSATLTQRGLEVFPYLRGQIPIDAGSWAYLATPSTSKQFETLVAGPDELTLLGVYHHADGREEMVQLFDANPAHVHGQLLRRGQLAWLTRGIYIGSDRNYLSIHIDDVLLPNYSWDTDRHETDVSPEASIRMSAADASRAARWSRARGLKLNLACNGGGSRRYQLEAGLEADPLLDALLAEVDAFGWINHTYEHRDLNSASRAVLDGEIERNVSWAREVGIEFEPHALVSGEHTGLANLAATPPVPENVHLAASLKSQRIRYLACDASRPYPAPRGGSDLAPGTPFVIGTTLVVPRHPTILAHDSATKIQTLDRLRHTGRVDVGSWEQIIDAEAKRIFTAVISNDPRPHYVHQSNLIGAGDERGASGLFYELLEAVLDRYERYVAPHVPPLQLKFAEIGRLLIAQEAWRAVLAAGSISGYVDGPQIKIFNSSTVPLEIPLTGTTVGEPYGDHNTGWIRVMPGETVFERQPDRLEPDGDRRVLQG